jgi:hypothetical protein
MVSSEPEEGGALDSRWTGQAYRIAPRQSTTSGLAATTAQSESAIVRHMFSNVPVIGYRELSGDYGELGQALSEMTQFEQGDEWKIEPPVYEAARYVAGQLMAKDVPPPRLFNHGPKSVVFNWTSSNNDKNLYLTVSADKISALISSPARIERRVEIDYSKLPNAIYALSASIELGADDRQIILFVTGAASASSRR